MPLQFLVKFWTNGSQLIHKILNIGYTVTHTHVNIEYIFKHGVSVGQRCHDGDIDDSTMGNTSHMMVTKKHATFLTCYHDLNVSLDVTKV